jgi:hypothetical protein
MRKILNAMVLVLCLPVMALAAPTPPAPQPVTVQNTPTVNVATMPAVEVSGTPTVNVATMPAVTVAGTPTVQLAPGTSVQVAQPAQTPFQIGLHISIAANQTSGANSFTVPAGKRAVIEYASAMGEGSSLGATAALWAETSTYGGGNTYMSLPLQAGPFGPIGSQVIKAYADSGKTIGCVLYLSQGPVEANCVLNGYFVDLPQQ